MQELLLLVIVFFGMEALLYSFSEKKWPIPFIAFILFLVAGFGATDVNNVFCAEVIGVMTCETTHTFNTELVILAGVMALLSVLLVFLRLTANTVSEDKQMQEV